MAGLRHNPAAPYCTKRVDLGDDAPPLEADARCDYCDARGKGPATDVPDDASSEPAVAATQDVSAGAIRADHVVPSMLDVQRPDRLAEIRDFFESLGLVKGGVISDIHTVDGQHFTDRHTILEMRGYRDQDIVMSLRPDGMQATVRRVVWRHIVSFQSR